MRKGELNMLKKQIPALLLLLCLLFTASAQADKYALQYSGLENSMDCTVNGVSKSRT